MGLSQWSIVSSLQSQLNKFKLKLLSIAFFSTVSTEDSVFVIGGRREPQKDQEQQYTNRIYRFRNETWDLVGNLYQQRVGHASIKIDNFFYVFGGSVRDSLGDPM